MLYIGVRRSVRASVRRSSYPPPSAGPASARDFVPEPQRPDVSSVDATVYTREDCHLCEEAVETLRTVAAEEDVDLSLDLVDVDADPELREEHGERVPYVLLEGRPAFKFRVDPATARSKLRAAADR